MQRFLLQSLTLMLRILQLLIVLLFSMGVFAPKCVFATCGDWLVHSIDAPLAANSNHYLEHAQTPRPCRGLHCKPSPTAPCPIPAPPLSERFQYQAMCSKSTLLPLFLINVRRTSEPIDLLLRPYQCGIERPPKV